MAQDDISSQTATTAGVPYVALGDSLTHGMQSLGVAWISQHRSYPNLIAGFLGAQPFKQPTLFGGEPENEHDANARRWIGCPPNLELVARAAAELTRSDNAPGDVRAALAQQGA